MKSRFFLLVVSILCWVLLGQAVNGLDGRHIWAVLILTLVISQLAYFQGKTIATIQAAQPPRDPK